MAVDYDQQKQKTEEGQMLDLSLSPGVKGKKKGYIVDATAGSDTLKGSKFDDVITAGGGTTIVYDANKVYGNDKINLTEEEELVVSVANDFGTEKRVAKNGKDFEFVSTAYTNTPVIYSVKGFATSGDTVELGDLKGIKYTKEVVAYNDVTEKWEKTIYTWTKDEWKKGTVTKLKDVDTESVTYIAKGAGVYVEDDELVDSDENLLAEREVYGVYAATQTKYWDDDHVGANVMFAENAKVLWYSKNDIYFYADENAKYTMTVEGKKPVAITEEVYNSLSLVTDFREDEVVQSSFTIVNAAKSGADSVYVNGTDVLNDSFNEATVKGNKVTGTVYGDYVDLDEVEEVEEGKKRQINLGAGNDKIYFDSEDGAGDNEITLTKGETLKIQDDEGGATVTYGYDAKGKEAVVTYNNDDEITTFTFKGLAANDVLAYSTDLEVEGDFVANQQFEAYAKENKFGGKDFKGTWLKDVATATLGDDTFKLGTGINEINGALAGEDIVTLSNQENLTLSDVAVGDVTISKEGNDIKIANGENSLTLKGYANDKTGARVWLKDGKYIWHQTINVIATSAKTEGTLGNDDIESQNLKNTFVEKYDSEHDLYGNDTITSAAGAVDTIQISAVGKVDKLEASDFVFDLAGDTITAVSENGSITYTQDQHALTANLENLTFQDATNKKYNFYETDATTIDLAEKFKDKDFKKVYKNNLITFADSATKVTDSAKNDIIYAGGADVVWNYANGGSDVYNSKSLTSDDTYNVVALGKKTDLEINDLGGDDDTLNITLDKSLIKKDQTANEVFEDKAMLIFDVVKKSANTFSYGSDLLITANDGKSFGQGIELGDYFKTTGTFARNGDEWDFGATAEYAGKGKIETINVKGAENDYTVTGLEDSIEDVAAAVAGWLGTHTDYNSAMDAIEFGEKPEVAELMALYANVDINVV